MASLSDRPTAPVIAWSSNGLRVLPHHQAAAHHHAADQGAIAAAPQQQQQRPQQLRGDRIILSQSALDGILRASSAAGGTALPSPLVFAITNPANLRKVYGSVREFTAPFDDAVFLSSELREALDIRIDDEEMVDADDGGGPVVNVSLVSTLPKCEYLRMAPMEPEYLELPDLRSLLESHIRQSRAVISLGDTLTVSQPSKRGAPPSEYHFLVTDIKPNQTCICVDVDVSLDVVPDDEVATEAVKRKFLAQPQPDGAAVIPVAAKGDGELFGQVTGSVAAGEYTVYKFKPGAERFFKIELSPATGDCDLFVSKSIERPTKQDHDYVNVDQGKSSIIVELDDPPAPFVFISVRGYSTKSTFTLSAASIKAGPPLPSAPSSSGPHDPDLAPDQVLCGNCLSPISAKAAVMHEAFCRRNNAVCHRCRGLGLPHVMKKEDLPLHWHCDDCDKIGTLSEQPKHAELLHTPLPCDDCGASFPLPQLPAHRRRDCPERVIECRFCHLAVRAGGRSRSAKDILLGEGFSEHESDCGSRTVECVKCRMNVQLKDMKIHAQMHELARQNQPTPPLCANTECGGFESEQYRNDMRLCRACYSPFWSTRHDPGNQKLAGKLAAAYHAQLTVGCGRKHCSNEFCATSANPSLTTTPLDPTTAAVHTVALLKKSFLYNPKSPSYSLCVADEASATRRKAAAHLVGLGFRVEWCVKALAECAGEANAASAWLFANAPRR